MSILHYDAEKEIALIRQDEREMGLEEGIQQGIQRGIQQGIQQGMQQGMQQGIRQGMQRGAQQEKQGIVENLLRQGILTLEQIVEVAKVSVDYVKECQVQINQ